jgi:hypothetical protein
MRAIALALLLATQSENPESLKIKRELADIRTIASAVEAYRNDNQNLPRAANVTELRGFLDPQYVRGLRIQDPWGTEYRYLMTEDGKHYRIVAAGSDTKFEKAHEKMTAEGPKQQLSNDAASDVVYQDGTFRIVPEGFERAFSKKEVQRVVPFQ